MRTIVKTELLKLKRYHIIWAGIALMLLSVLLTLFTSMANDGSVWDFRYLIEQVIKNNMSMIFPMCIALIAGYIISREEKDDVLKNIITIPISFKKLLVGKLIVCAMLSILFGLICRVYSWFSWIYSKFGNPRASTNNIGKFTFVSSGITNYCYNKQTIRRLYDRCHCCFCVWIWRYVCSRKYDIG